MTSETPRHKPRTTVDVNRIRDGSIDVDVEIDDINTSRTDSAARRMQIFDPNKPLGMQKLFPRRIVATRGAIALLTKSNVELQILIKHHLFGDWGDSDSDEIELNDFAVVNEMRVMGTYRIADWRTQQALSAHDRAELPTVWVFTQYDPSVTSVMLPSEY